MPELPDVEAFRRYLLSQGLVGLAITGAELLWRRAVRTPSAEELEAELSGRRILDIRRRAKYLVLPLDGKSRRVLILHLGMTGSLVVNKAGRERPRHTRSVLLLERRVEICFVDPRKLGKMSLVGDDAEALAGLGPEPLDPAFTPGVLGERLAGRSAPVKALLCNQAVVAGIGNICADEVLFLASLHPLKQGGSLSSDEIRRLHDSIVTRLPEATELLVPIAGRGGPPTESEQGGVTLMVPRSAGQPCTRCGTPIKRVPVRGRSTYFCPSSQVR